MRSRATITIWHGGGGRRARRVKALLSPLYAIHLTLSWMFFPCITAAQAYRSSLPELTTTRAVHDLSMAEAAREYPVHLHAIVTYYDPYLDYPQPILMVTDKTGSVFVKLPLETTPESSPELRTGQMVEVLGQSVPGGFAPDVDRPRIRVLGESHLPARAPVRTLPYLLSGAEDAPWVAMDGVVHSVQESEHNVTLRITGSDGVFSAVAVKTPGVDYRHLIDSKVRIRGVACSLFNKRRQIVGVQLRFASIAMVEVVEPGPKEPFDLPVSPIRTLLSFVPGELFDHRVHIRGIVTLFWPGRLLCIQDGAEGLCAQTAETDALSLGRPVDLIGFPQIGNYTPTLSNSVYRAGPDPRPVTISTVGAEQASRGEYDAQLVRIEGRLIGRDSAADDPRIILSSGKFIFSASLPRSSDARELLGLEEASRLSITGISSTRVDDRGSTDPDGYVVARSFRILLRSSGDVVVVERPSWWSAKHTLRLLVFALILTLCVLAWVLRLRRRLEKQTELLQFQATHDGLTGLWNRKAIMDMLHRELELASRSAVGIGVMMLDADHFKRVNDTYGHPGGDTVLQAISERIRESVRSTELIGRYGGEEFLILLPNSDEAQVANIAERVRGAVAEKPVRLDEVEVSITVSVGTSVLKPFVHTEREALAAADSALYEAKHGGRNRVVASMSEVGAFVPE